MIATEIIIVALILAVAVFYFVRLMRKQFDSGSGCGKGCSVPGKPCSHCPSGSSHPPRH
jgi:hypothetical protein